jgi:hypothetical protein
VQAIRFKNDKYWIDPEKCVDCGHCVTVCHNGVISAPGGNPPKCAPHEPIHRTCDVVVIGAGASGTAAAARAAADGRKVIVLEKNHEIGGSAWYAHMYRTHYSKWHADAGVPDTREQTLAQFEKKTGGQVDMALMRNILDSNEAMNDWLITEHDLGKDYSFTLKGPFGKPGFVSTYLEPINTRRIDTSIGPAGNGWYFCNKFHDIAVENGAEFFFNTPAKHLLLDESGAICGVVAEDDGGTIEISCKAVVVAAGAMTRSVEWVNKMQPGFYDDDGTTKVHVFTCATCSGDGLTMCDEIGADIDTEHKRVVMFGPARHPYPCVTLNITRGGGPNVMFNSEGKLLQFAMEMSERSFLADEPGRYCWSILDDSHCEAAIARSYGGEKDVVGIDLEASYDRWREFIAEEVEAGSIVMGNTLEELGKNLGFPDPAAFARDAYAESTKQPMMGPPPGGDDDGPGGPPDGPDGGPGGPGGPGGDGPEDGGMFGDMPPMPPTTPLEKAPFYAFRQKLFHENAIGGMKIDSDTRVLKNGQPIPGLFACGDNCSGIMLSGAIGVQYIEGVVSALTFAFNSGYLSGTRVSDYTK